MDNPYDDEKHYMTLSGWDIDESLESIRKKSEFMTLFLENFSDLKVEVLDDPREIVSSSMEDIE